MLNVLVVEDDFAVRKLTSIMLKNAGFTPVACATAAAAVAQIKNEVISLALIDVMLPDTDGLSLVKLLRGINPDLPVIMVTAKGLPADKRAGFYAGADDYLVKPVDEEELILRIRALLRRSSAVYENKLSAGGIDLDYSSMSAKINGENCELTQKEFILLFALLSKVGKILTREELIKEAWGEKLEDDRTLNVHLNRLREKIEPAASVEIKVVRGLGYKAVIK